MSRLLIPVDFSHIAANAVEYAIGLAPEFQAGISLLHVVDNEEQTLEAEKKMEEFRAQFNTDVPIKQHILIGNLFEDIAKAAELLEVYMVVMGTSGLKGLQYLFGSHALKIVTSARVPFLITQEDPPKPEIKNIVVPIDLSSEDKQILSLALQASRLFEAKVHLFVAHHTDEFQRNRTYRNEQFAHRYLDDHQVHYTTIHAEGKTDFASELLEYSELIDANLIAAVNHKEQGFMNLLGRNFDQKIITNNAKIPTLVMNAHQHKRLTDVFDVFE